MTGKTDQWIKLALAALAIVVLVGAALARRFLRRTDGGDVEPKLARVERVSTWALGLLAVIGVGNYFGFDVDNLTKSDRLDGYDLVNYYLNSKYFDECGYTGLYEAIVIADLERKDNFRRWGFQAMRDLDSSQRISVASVRARADEIKARFTKARWRQFKHDFRFLQRTISRRLQIELLNDHGYNGTPFLQTVAGAFTYDLPVERLKTLCHLETVLVVLMFLMVWRTYGTRMALWAVLWTSVSFSARWPGVSFGIFRLDWVVALVVAGCLLADADEPPGDSRWKKAKPFVAGALISWAVMEKIFPLVWLFGLGARALWRLIDRRTIEPVFAKVMIGFLAASVLFGAVAYRTVGMRNIREFAEDMEEHLRPENLSQQRMGFGVALAYRGEYGRFAKPGDREDKWALVGDLERVRYAGAILALVLLGLTIRPRDDRERGARTAPDDAFWLGFLPFYFLMIASHYYWVNRLSPLLHHARHEDDGDEHVVALAVLFGIEVTSNYIDQTTHFRYALTGTASVALGLYAAWVIGARLWRTYRGAGSQSSARTASGRPAIQSRTSADVDSK